MDNDRDSEDERIQRQALLLPSLEQTPDGAAQAQSSVLATTTGAASGQHASPDLQAMQAARIRTSRMHFSDRVPSLQLDNFQEQIEREYHSEVADFKEAEASESRLKASNEQTSRLDTQPAGCIDSRSDLITDQKVIPAASKVSHNLASSSDEHEPATTDHEHGSQARRIRHRGPRNRVTVAAPAPSVLTMPLRRARCATGANRIARSKRAQAPAQRQISAV